MNPWLTTAEQVLSGLPYFVAVFLVAFLGKLVFQYTSSFEVNAELTERDNPAFGVAFAGYMVGLAIALSGAFFGTAWDHIGADLLHIAVFGGLATVLMRISVWLNDKAILYKFCIGREIAEDRNVGTGLVVAGSSIATGFMLKGVLSGFSESLWLGLRDAGLYFPAGQAILIVGAQVYTRTSRYDVHEEIEHDHNIAAGMSFGGFLAGLGYIAGTALTGAGSRWSDELATAAVMAAVGILILLAARVIADKLLLPKSVLAKEVAEDQNPAAGAMAAASFLLVALLFANSVHTLNLDAIRLAAASEAPIEAVAELEHEPAPDASQPGGGQ